MYPHYVLINGQCLIFCLAVVVKKEKKKKQKLSDNEVGVSIVE